LTQDARAFRLSPALGRASEKLKAAVMSVCGVTQDETGRNGKKHQAMAGSSWKMRNFGLARSLLNGNSAPQQRA